jgi:hypothetical protein
VLVMVVPVFKVVVTGGGVTLCALY